MTVGDWFTVVSAHPRVSEGIFVVGVLVLFVLRPVLHRTRMGARLDSALTIITIGLVCGVLSVLGGGDRTDGVFLYTYAGFVAAMSIGTVHAALVLFVDFYLRERQGAAVSTIFRDVAGILIYFVIILVVLRYTLDINVASLIATSAVLTAIIGLALQDVLGALISGLVLELESSFSPHDWIKVGNFEGQVIETGWRTTKIRTRVNEVITLPNTHLAREPVVNYSRPDHRYGDTLLFDAAYEVTPDQVKRAVLAVLAEERAVMKQPPAEVWTSRFKDFSIEYAVRYWLDDFDHLPEIRDRLTTSLWYALRRAGVRIPFPTRETHLVREHPQPALERGDPHAILAQVPLFKPLSEENLHTLAAQARRLIFGQGEAIVREGEPGDSFYVIEHGRVEVVIHRQDGAAGRAIAELGSGDFFGEMSLLAGDARSATVVAQGDVAVLEVRRDAFHDILIADPAVLEPICQLATHRQKDQRERREQIDQLPAFAADPAAQRLLVRIKTFFRL